MTQPNERITFTTSKADAKFALEEQGDGKLPKLSGYAICWNQLSDDRGGFKFRLKPQSGTPTDPCAALANHEFACPMGTTANGTLTLTEDDYGVKFSVDPADTSYSRDMIALVRRGDVEGMSFGMMNQGLQFTAVKENGQNIRDVSAFVYDEITFTSIPAFTGTSVSSEFAAKEEPTAEPTVEKPVDILQSKPEPVATPLRNKMSIERKREELRNILSK